MRGLVATAGLLIALILLIFYLVKGMATLLVMPPMILIALWCRWRGFHTAAAMITAGLAIPFTALLMGVLQYPMILLGMPLQDHLLLRLDAALGIDWAVMYETVYRTPWLRETLLWSYDSTFLRLAVLSLLLAWWDRTRMRQMLAANLGCGVSCILIFGLMPTLGPIRTLGLSEHYPQVGLTTAVERLEHLRAGVGAFEDVLFGLVFFPSYHTVGLALTAFGVSVFPRWIRYPVYAWCVVVFLSVPPIGGHYVMDALVGLLLTWGWFLIFNKRGAEMKHE